MWDWEQGRLEYFQFDELRKIAKFGRANDLRTASREELESAIGLAFLPADPAYRPWRNYGRLFQIAMIAAPDEHGNAPLTALSQSLAQDGKVTTDDYLHFLARATTQPSPALSTWDHSANLRYPLLFALRYLLIRVAEGHAKTTLSDVVYSYRHSGFRGDEGRDAFLRLSGHSTAHDTGSSNRQANESLRVLAQLSYLTSTRTEITVSLAPSDVATLFEALTPVPGTPLQGRPQEIARRAAYFSNAGHESDLHHPSTVLTAIVEAGFTEALPEGRRVRRTHVSIERNRMIRQMYFQQHPAHTCDFCSMNMRTVYPWTDRLLEIHHLLPLCSGARTSTHGTLLEDLVANCPSCHRAVHRYYDKWLAAKGQVDFRDATEAKHVYGEAKQRHKSPARVGASQ